jgi:diacylglycerol O-acyltransferase / wax synthase
VSKNERAAIERLSLPDLTNLAVEAPDTPMHVGAIGVLDGGPLLDADRRVDIELIRRHIEGRLGLVPELRRVLWKTAAFQGRPLWVDDPTFRIEDHVLLATLPTPGGDQLAIRFAEREMAILMDRARPLWQLWFFEGYSPGKVGVFLKLHHVLADGAAVLKIISLLFDLSPAPRGDPPPAPWLPAPPPSPGALYRDNAARKLAATAEALRNLAHPLRGARMAALSIRGVWSVITEGFGAPRTSFNRPVDSKRRVAVMRIGLAETKAVARSCGATVNDLVLDLIAGGLRAVLLSRGEPVQDVNIRASMAVALRPLDRAAPVGNHSGTMIVPLPVDERDPRARMGVIKAGTVQAKHRQRGEVSQVFMVLLALSGLTRFFIRRQHLVNILVTNLAGPTVPLYVAGAHLLDAFAITPVAGNVTASFAALSYDGNLDLTMCVDAGSWPDLDVLVRGMNETWYEVSTQRTAA